ncbi:unnamed protein product [Pedinophyceae sp. YPF-701]|nr:unnamed protein product [Pedinophyceae sp. YPF-701]
MGVLEALGLAKKPDPKELVREWQRVLRREQMKADREIRDIEREKKKTELLIKQAAKRKDIVSCKILAKEVAQAKRAVTRLYTNKAHMMGVAGQLTEQLSLLRVTGQLEKSTEVLQGVTSLIRIPQLHDTMRNMSKEMCKAGLIEEMVGGTMEDVFEDDGIEEEAEEEVNKVLEELAVDMAMPNAPKAAAQAQAVQATAQRREGVKL